MTPDYTELERLAKAATPGPWKTHLVDDTVVIDNNGGVVTDCWPGGGLDDDDDFTADVDQFEADASYIAAADPAVMLAIVAERNALAARVKELEAALRPFADEGRVWSGHIEPSKTITGEATLLTAGHLFAASKAMEGK